MKRVRDARTPPKDMPGPNVERGGDALSLPRAADQWVSAEAVRRLIGAWAYGALAAADRPASADVRRAIGIGCAIAEIALQDGRSPFSARAELPLWEIDVEVSAARLGELAGYTDRDTVAGVELLRRSGAVLAADERGTRVRLAEAVCAPSPGAVGVSWGAARAALHDLNVAIGAMAAPLAVLREVAWASGPVPDPTSAPHVRYSVRELEAATFFSRSTVSEALGLLERAGLLVTEARRGQTLRCALAPLALGLAPVAPIAAESRQPEERVTDPQVAVSSAPAMSGQARDLQRPTATGSTVLLGEFAGTPIHGPPGTPLILECDEQGRWTCRVGPHLRLGPVD